MDLNLNLTLYIWVIFTFSNGSFMQKLKGYSCENYYFSYLYIWICLKITKLSWCKINKLETWLYLVLKKSNLNPDFDLVLINEPTWLNLILKRAIAHPSLAPLPPYLKVHLKCVRIVIQKNKSSIIIIWSLISECEEKVLSYMQYF